MTEQLQLRRGTASQVAAFTGAQGEVVVDTTNNRAVVNDGTTAGGWPLAKLAEVVTNTRVGVADANYTALSSDRLIAYTALTAARVVTLCAASAYPTGARLMIVDESGASSTVKTITVAAAGSDAIDGAASFVIDAAYGGLEIESNGANAWTILSPRPNLQAALIGIGTAPDPSNVLSAYGASALFNGTNFSLTINKGAAGDTASLIFEDAFSGRAQLGLSGSDNFSFKVSANGSAWTTAIALDAATGAPTFANQRTAVADAAYSALVTDRLIAYTALTAARVVGLPAASSFPPGHRLVVVDESGACSATNTLTLSRAGADTINGAASGVIASAYGYLALESNGVSAWTIVDQSTLSMAQQAANNVAITGGAISGVAGLLATGAAGVGYASGAGGAVTQATSKSTGVTLNKTTGQITMSGAALAASTIVSFALTNSTIAATDLLVLNHSSGGTAGAYQVNAQCAAGSATINVRNLTTGSLSESIVIAFALVKGATS
jgi:hypothetical protein